MNSATLGQRLKVRQLIKQKNVTAERMQKLLASGLLADLLSIDVENVNRSTFRWAIRLNVFPIWKTIILKGHYENVDVLRQQVEKIARAFDLDVDDFLKRNSFKGRPMDIEVDAVLISGIDLGFEDKSIYKGNIFERALDFGLALCPSDLGYSLQEKYGEQPENDVIFIAMDPIYHSSHPGYSILELMRYGSRKSYLAPIRAWNDHCFDAKSRFVFIKPREGQISF